MECWVSTSVSSSVSSPRTRFIPGITENLDHRSSRCCPTVAICFSACRRHVEPRIQPPSGCRLSSSSSSPSPSPPPPPRSSIIIIIIIVESSSSPTAWCAGECEALPLLNESSWLQTQRPRARLSEQLKMLNAKMDKCSATTSACVCCLGGKLASVVWWSKVRWHGLPKLWVRRIRVGKSALHGAPDLC